MAYYPVGTVFSDSMFQDAVAQASGRQQLAQNRSQEDQTRSNYDFGMGAGGEANPFGQKQLLDRTQNIDRVDSMNQAASRPGGVRSGAYKVRQGNQVFGQAQQRDSLQRSFDNATLGYARQREDIGNQYNSDIYNAGLGSVERALDRVVPDPDPAAGGGAAAGNTVANFTKTKTAKAFGFGKKPQFKSSLKSGKTQGVSSFVGKKYKGKK